MDLNSAFDGVVARAIREEEDRTGRKISPISRYGASVLIGEDSVTVEIKSENINAVFPNKPRKKVESRIVEPKALKEK